MQTVAEGAEEAAVKLRSRGLDVVIRKLESLGEQQELDAIEALVKEGIKGLAITPSDSPEIYAALDRVVDLGIPGHHGQRRRAAQPTDVLCRHGQCTGWTHSGWSGALHAAGRR